MNKAFKFKLKPNKNQKTELVKWFGAGRFIWNKFLETNVENYKLEKKFLFKFDMSKQLPKLKQENQWLKEVPAHILLNKVFDLDNSMKRVWKQGNGFPKFKSKKFDLSGITINQVNQHIKPQKKQIKIPKIGWIKWNKYRNLEGKLKSITIKQESGYWWCICLCEIPEVEVKEFNINYLVGIDLGLKDFCILSDGEVFSTPKYYRKKQQKLKILQRKHAKKKKSSKNKEKARKKLNKLHYKIKNQRKDFTHKISTQIVNDYLFVAVEDLNIKGMTKNRRLSKSIQDQGWAMFIEQLQYKSKAKGGYMVKIDRFAPSTKTCSNCGHKQKITLSERTFKCQVCTLVMDRDLNAAKNIKHLGLKKLGVEHTLMPVEIPLMEEVTYDTSSYVSMNQEKFFVFDKDANIL